MFLLNTWQFNVLVAIIFSVLFIQYYKLAVQGAKKDGISTIMLQLIAGISVLLLVPFFDFKFPSEPKFYVLLVFASIFYALNDRLQTTVRRYLDVSVASIINTFKTFFLVLIGLVIFKEDFVLIKILGAILILIGNSIIFWRYGKFEINKYVTIGIFATMAFAVAMSIDIGISSLFNLPIYVSITLVIPAMIIFFVEKHKISEIKDAINNANMKYFLITGLSWPLFIVFSLRAYQFGEVTRVAPLLATTVILNVIVAYFFHQEKSHLVRKLIASSIVFVGVYLTIIS